MHRSFNPKEVAILLGLASLLIAMYWGGVSELLFRWDRQEEYSHGYLLPLIALFFAWHRLPITREMPSSPSWAGPLLALFTVFIYIAGELSALYILVHYAIILSIIAFILAASGWRILNEFKAAIAVLIFAIPLPYFIEAGLTAQLQLISSRIGVEFIRFCEIPAFLEGNIIDLGSYKLQVVEACSGLRYLFPLLSLAFISAYMYQDAMWKRIVIFISAIPITVFMNSFRIGLVGLFVEYYGIEAAEGFMHDFEGWVIFMACMALLLMEIYLLSCIGKNAKRWNEVFGLSDHGEIPPAKADSAKKYFSAPFISTLLISLASFIAVYSVEGREEISPEHKDYALFPTEIDNWHGNRDVLDNRTIDQLGFSDYLLIDYVDDNAQHVNFYVAYYESQRKGVSPHSPRVCIPGGGWEITEFDRIVHNGAPINKAIVQKEETKQVVYYWFQQRGRVIANEYLMKWHLLTDSIIMNRTDGALIRLTTLVQNGESTAEAELRLKSFYDKINNTLPDYIPN